MTSAGIDPTEQIGYISFSMAWMEHTYTIPRTVVIDSTDSPNFWQLLFVYTMGVNFEAFRNGFNIVFLAARSTAQASLPMDGRPSIKEVGWHSWRTIPLGIW